MAYVQGKNPAGEVINANDGVTNGSDQIIGNAGNDTIFGLGGNDTIKGGGGADYIDGGAGRDAVSYEDSQSGVLVSLSAGGGMGGTAEGDTLVNIEDVYGSGHNDTLAGDMGNNALYGLGGDDTLKGGGGADYLDGGLGADRLEGGYGDDTLVIDGADDSVSGGEGIDTLRLDSDAGLYVSLLHGFVSDAPYHRPSPYQPPRLEGIENVTGSAHNDTIIGTNGANVLSGGEGSDELRALDGNDELSGGEGNDALTGGRGIDRLTGGAGQDTFVFTSLNDSEMANWKPQDVILDFTKYHDKIDLSQLSFDISDLLVVDGISIDGTNYSYVGVDQDHNGYFSNGDFAVAVVMAPGTVLGSADLII